MLTIRRINPGEWRLYREVRLASLKDAPEAFATTYDSAAQRPPGSWEAQADGSAEGSGADRFTFLVFFNDVPVGLAALYRDADAVTEGEIIQVWIAPGHRSSGVSGQLLEFIFEVAKDNGFEELRAEVRLSNQGAMRFYERHGFRRAGQQPELSDSSVVLIKEV